MGPTRLLLEQLDRPLYATIAARRAAEDRAERTDILSLLLEAETEDGERLTPTRSCATSSR